MTTANLLYVKHPFAYINEDAIPNTITYITRFNDKNIFFYGICLRQKTLQLNFLNIYVHAVPAITNIYNSSSTSGLRLIPWMI